MPVAGQDRVWDVGEVAVVTIQFRNAAGALADPTSVTLKVKDPSGDIGTYTYAASSVTKDSTGVYHKDVTITESGKWIFSFIGAGTVATAETVVISVRTDPFAVA